ncbi:kinesin-domain-containing protein [Panus rudis PR-1116 ss-1]|nr:kinesin-domain-containing protein [Panus rudis PR-1116 ss-1]
MNPTSLKRKMSPDEGNDPPRKRLAPIPEAKQPLQDSKPGTNVTTRRIAGPSALTKPQAPAFTTRRVTRATSAPPTRPPTTTTRPGAGTARPAAAARKPISSRATTGPARRGTAEDQRFQALQDQMTNLETARVADAARLAQEMEAERAKVAELQENHLALSRELAAAKTQEINQRRELVNASDEIDQLKKRHANEVMDLEMALKRKERENRELQEDLRVCKSDLEREREMNTTLKATIAQQSTSQITFTTQITALQAQVTALQTALDVCNNQKSQVEYNIESAQKRIAELEDETRKAEMVRRKLHNMVQELKGNIRVFCRVRPLLPSDLTSVNGLLRSSSSSGEGSGRNTPENEEQLRQRARAAIEYPDTLDHKEIVVRSASENAMGQERTDQWMFTFDRVFEPHSTQAEVFEEISQLAQSCTDGYNVCVFAYGQTGSGKSFTMEGGSNEADAGMIPRAVEQVFQVAEELKSKGWEYKMAGQMLEIYNETINDLLGKGEFDKKKHEIKHDKHGRTTVTDVNVVPLSSASQVRSLLSVAQSRRTVASTLMNERSSRSHSVFTLRIYGENKVTGETCEGSLNLVDLAGSERLEKSGAGNDKDRLRETQNINKSLSALGDVIAALGEKGEGKSEKHIPYRNSKLTYLLQNSLSGNSKTLMVLNLSPLATHLNESLCSLRFATKVNNTTIGTAKKQNKSLPPS